MKQFLLIDYKGKHYTINDKIVNDAYEYQIGKITKEEALDKEFVVNHKALCIYYGIPAYIGKDKEMNGAYGN